MFPTTLFIEWDLLEQNAGSWSSLILLLEDLVFAYNGMLMKLNAHIFSLVSLTECDVSANDLEELPPTIGLLRHLRTLIADENFLSDIPCELGSCSGLTVLSGVCTGSCLFSLVIPT